MAELKGKDALEDQTVKKILSFIHRQKGLDTSSYRQNFILRRLNLRLLQTKSGNYQEYLKLLETDSQEPKRFVDNLSINVTEFFRDPEVFDIFKKEALRKLIAEKTARPYQSLRVWSAGCANGEEAYSLAIIISEELAGKKISVKIWGTDIDEQALAKARKGIYAPDKLKEADKGIIKKYFSPLDNGCCGVNSLLKAMVEFKSFNLADDPPFKLLDVIVCRNVMIYLSRDQKAQLLKRFHRVLNPNGYLITSKVESVWERDLFNPVFLREKIYQKIG